MALPSPEPALPLDADLRPEGRQGPLVRTIAAYASHYERRSEVWERQALLRAAPLAGPPALLERFFEVVDPIRWPADELSDAQVREVRRIKARVESERLPRGADPSTHLKLGPGGLSDVEWTVQLFSSWHAATIEGLRTTRTRTRSRPPRTRACSRRVIDLCWWRAGGWRRRFATPSCW